MIVKCPQCATGYSIPEAVFADKPKKMRCSRCKNIFTLMRRQEHAPAGYEEFTGAQHLPQEFAFLKEAKQAPAPEPAAPAEAPFAVVRPSTPPADGAAPRVSSVPVPAPPPPRGPAPQAPVPAAQAELAAPTDVVAQVLAAAAAAPPPPPVAPPPRPQPAPQPVAQVAPPVDSWEEETPLELAGYAIPAEPQSHGAQAFGKFIVVVFVLGAAFLGYVSYRNGWHFSVSELGSQISFAFSGKQYEEIAEEARDLEVVVTSRKLVPVTGDAKYLVVSGDVVNHGPTGLSRIVLSGKITDAAGELRAELRAPCGKVLDEATISRTAKGAISGHYMERDGLYNCVISYKGSSPFQVVFDDLPAGYDPSAYALQVKAVSAQVAE
jgi:predicted Zn finger-like uncharacterized protein